MNHRQIDEHQIAERYVLGQLPADQAAAFEEHSLACPECLDRLEMADALHQGLRRVAAEEATASAVRLGVLARLARWRLAPAALAVAAAALLLAALLPAGLLLQRADRLEDEVGRLRSTVASLENAATLEDAPRGEDCPTAAAGDDPRTADDPERRRLEERLAGLEAERQRLDAALAAARDDARRAVQPFTRVALLTLSPTRSGPGDPPAPPEIVLPTGDDGSGLVVLSLDVAGREASSYRAVLRGPDGTVRWSADGLRPDPTGLVDLALPADLLAPGDHVLRLEAPADDAAVDDTGAAIEFAFRALPPA